MFHAKRVVLGAALLLAVACASEKNTVTMENGDIVLPVAAQSYLNHKNVEIQRLERRVTDLKAMSANSDRTFKGSHENLDLLIAQQFEK